MSQLVRIECQSCEAVEEYEFEGCLILGNIKDKGLFVKQHEFSLAQALRDAPQQWVELIATAFEKAMEDLKE